MGRHVEERGRADRCQYLSCQGSQERHHKKCSTLRTPAEKLTTEGILESAQSCCEFPGQTAVRPALLLEPVRQKDREIVEMDGDGVLYVRKGKFASARRYTNERMKNEISANLPEF